MISTFFLFFHPHAHLFTVRSQFANAVIRPCTGNHEHPVARPA